jgi:glycosyltransferase involved in cell wall biosynthesis
MLKQAPTVSVVVPLYNVERYIGQALSSILRQTFVDFEVLVVNDASSDRSRQIVDQFAKNDPRVSMITQENRGLAGARNTGIRNARGKFIAFLDADDLWQPTKLEAHVSLLTANPEVGVSFSASELINPDGSSTGLFQTSKIAGIQPSDIFCRNPIGNGSAPVIRREVIAYEALAPEGVRICWFDETFRQSEDIELWSRIAVTTEWQFAGIPNPLTLYRINSSGLSADVEKQLASWKKFRDKLQSINPQIVSEFGQRAEAYQLRYLARRSSVAGDGRRAIRLLWQAVKQYPRIASEEAAKTLQTGILALTAMLLPRQTFNALRAMLLRKGSPEVAAG